MRPCLDSSGTSKREPAKSYIHAFNCASSRWHFLDVEGARRVGDGKLKSAFWDHDKGILEIVFDEVSYQ
jgi:hypothetical protein